VHAPTADLLIVDADGVRVASVHGALDVFSASGVTARVLEKVPSTVHAVVIDLEEAEAIDTGGVSALVRLGERARARALDVSLRVGDPPRLSPTMVAILRHTFDVEDDDSDATSARRPLARNG
jgi:anti-anti-sigma regulatory factor